jgi:hypothetical protein
LPPSMLPEIFTGPMDSARRPDQSPRGSLRPVFARTHW